MNMSDLRHITQENIDDAYVNVTSAEMCAEVREYNIICCICAVGRKQFPFR